MLRFVPGGKVLTRYLQVIPHAIDYFTGKALEYEDYEDDEALYETDEDDEENGDGDDDDVRVIPSRYLPLELTMQQESGSDAPPPRRGGKKGGAAGKQVGAEDCKQQ